MGEYATRTSDGVRVKIGTCEDMYYLRYEDRTKVKREANSIDPQREPDLRWRLPFPDEDSVQIGEYEHHNRGYRLWREGETGHCVNFTAVNSADAPGTIQLKHECGLLLNVPCYHGDQLPSVGDCKVFWNGKSWFFELASIKNTEDGDVLPVVHCRHCRTAWLCSWEEIQPYLHGEMKRRLSVYAPLL